MIVTKNLSKQGAIVIEGRHRIPELAKITLDKWALKRVHDLKIVTKAHKYNFPFHDKYNQKRAYRKVFEIIKKQIERQIPYLAADKLKLPFIDIGHTTTEVIIFNICPGSLNPVGSREIAKASRYLSRLNHYIQLASLPMSLNFRHISKLTEGGLQLEVIEVRLSLSRMLMNNGYLILYHLPEIIKAIETLHRKACYVT